MKERKTRTAKGAKSRPVYKKPAIIAVKKLDVLTGSCGKTSGGCSLTPPASS